MTNTQRAVEPEEDDGKEYKSIFLEVYRGVRRSEIALCRLRAWSVAEADTVMHRALAHNGGTFSAVAPERIAHFQKLFPDLSVVGIEAVIGTLDYYNDVHVSKGTALSPLKQTVDDLSPVSRRQLVRELLLAADNADPARRGFSPMSNGEWSVIAPIVAPRLPRLRNKEDEDDPRDTVNFLLAAAAGHVTWDASPRVSTLRTWITRQARNGLFVVLEQKVRSLFENGKLSSKTFAYFQLLCDTARESAARAEAKAHLKTVLLAKRNGTEPPPSPSSLPPTVDWQARAQLTTVEAALRRLDSRDQNPITLGKTPRGTR